MKFFDTDDLSEVIIQPTSTHSKTDRTRHVYDFIKKVAARPNVYKAAPRQEAYKIWQINPDGMTVKKPGTPVKKRKSTKNDADKIKRFAMI